MKKSLVILGCALGLTLTGVAQDKNFKPTEGMTTLEVTFSPASIFNASAAGNTFSLPSTGGLNNGIKYRKWLGSDIALRNTFLLGFKNSTNPYVATNSVGDDVDLNESAFEWAVQLRPGIERHFSGTKRLSPYLGSELIIGFGSNSYTSQSLDAADAIVESYRKNTLDYTNQSGMTYNWNYANGFLIGAGLVGGFDYYVAENLFLGLELNYAFVYNKRFSVKSKMGDADEVVTKTGSNVSFAPAAGANLRLGWNF